MKILNPRDMSLADSFLRLFGATLERTFDSEDYVVEILPLPDSENHYNDIAVRLGKRIFISERQTGALGLTTPELYALIAHELGHIVYHTAPWDVDTETRADTLAAELGLGNQMISLIEKIILSRRYRDITSQLVRRIQYLKHIA